MKKLEDIPKKEVFNVPDGYFDKLPGVIQSRVAESEERTSRPVFRMALQYGLPSLAIVVIAVLLFFKPDTADHSAESILASIETPDLVAYLNETDISTDELLDEVVLNTEDAEQIEETVYDLNLGDTDLENIADDLDL
jgi:hypothetical protein